MNQTENIIPLCFESTYSWVISYLIKGLDNKFVLVDVPAPIGKETWEDELAQKLVECNVHFEQLSLIIITHAHVDHFGSLASFKKKYNVLAPVLIHEKDAPYLMRGESAPIRAWENNERGKFASQLVNTLPMSGFAPYTPEIVVNEMENNTIDFNLGPYGLPEGFLFYTPGHTQGSISLVLKNNREAIVGDLIFASKQKGMTTPLIHLFAQDENLVFDNIKNLLSLGVELFHGGHGGFWSADQVELLLSNHYMKLL